jgi:hypothetical protein
MLKRKLVRDMLIVDGLQAMEEYVLGVLRY